MSERRKVMLTAKIFRSAPGYEPRSPPSPLGDLFCTVVL